MVTLSTAEAEYICAVEAGKEIAWMRNILSELGYPFSLPCFSTSTTSPL